MRVYKGKVGQSIQQAAKDAVALAKKTDKRVILSFNEIEIVVTNKMTPASILEEYRTRCDAARAAYEASDVYKEARKRAEEKEAKRAAELAAALETAPAQPTMRDAEAWATFKKINTDPYGAAVVSYSESWARAMEGRMATGATLEQCADDASHLADVEGITGFMYGCAVAELARCWIHGEALRIWHNTKYGVDEAKAKGGTVNPAILTMGGGD